MATLTDSTFTRSTRIVPASRPRLTMSLLRALDTIGVVETYEVSGGRGSAFCSAQATLDARLNSRQAQVCGPVQASGAAAGQISVQDQVGGQAEVSQPSQNKAFVAGYHHDHNSITTTNDVALLLDSHKPCGVVDGRGSMKDAFAISLGSRPPSPPVL